MKRFFYSLGLMLAASLTLTNCTEEIENPAQEPESAGVPFEIVASTVDTKTVNDGMSTKWAAEDKINLFHAVCDGDDYKNNGAFTVNEVESGNFKGELYEKLDPQEEYDWYAFYPYTSQITSPENESGWAYVGNMNGIAQMGGYGNTAHLASSNCPLYGVAKAVPAAETPSIQMKHLSSVVAINVTNNTDEPLTITTATFTANEPIVGSFYIDFSGAPTYTPSEEQYVSNAATVNVEGGTALGNGDSGVLYLVIKPFTAVKDSKLYLSVNGYEKELTMPNDVTFTAGKIKTLNFNYNYVAPAGEQSVIFDFTSTDELEVLGVALPSDGTGTDVTTLTNGDVTLVAAGGTTDTRVWNSKGTYDLRAYKGATLTFSVPKGYVINDVIWEGNNINAISKSIIPSNPVVLTIADNAETQKISTIKVKYAEGEVQMIPLTMGEVACSNIAPNSLTFSWNNVSGAVGYKVSVDGGETYSDVQDETLYTWEDLDPETEYTLYVKAIGNGLNTSDSEAVSCTATTAEEPIDVEEVDLVIDLTQQGYSNQQEVSSVSKNPIQVAFDKGTNSNSPKYYTSGTAVRLYGGGYFTVSSDKVIVKVVITFGTSDGSNAITSDSGTYSEGTWIGNTKSVRFNVGGTSGNRRIQKLVVTYQKTVGEVILASRDLKFSSAEVSATLGQEFTAPTLSGEVSGVSYTSSNTDVATVNEETGEVTLVSAGTTTITASAPETAEYEAGEVSYTLTVAEASSTQESIYTWTATSGALGTTTNGTITKTLEGIDWAIERNGTGYTGWTSGAIQIGKNGDAESMTLTTSGIAGTIKSVSVECSSYQAKHNVSISVGGVFYVSSQATSSWTTVGTVSGEGTASGEIQIKFIAGTGARAMYVKSITIVYEAD